MAEESDDRIVQEHEGFHHGEEVEILSDRFEGEGVSEGETGTLYISEVGAEKYQNLRVKMSFVPEGADEPMGIDLDPMMLGEDFAPVTV